MSNIMVTFNQLRLENQRWIIEKDDIEAIDKEADNFFRTGNDYPLEVFTVFIAISDEKEKCDQDPFQMIMTRPL